MDAVKREDFNLKHETRMDQIQAPTTLHIKKRNMSLQLILLLWVQ